MQDVYFLTLSQGTSGLGAWLRFNKVDNYIWAIVTMPGDGGIIAHKAQPRLHGGEKLSNPSIYQHFNVLPSVCQTGEIKWDLRWEHGQQMVRLFPYQWMYRLAWPSTKLETLGPRLRCSGTIKIGDQSFEVKDAPAHLGHTWGSHMAHSWAWAAGSSFGGKDAYFEALSARVPVCGLLSPPITLARLHVGNEQYGFCKPGGWLSQLSSWNRAVWQLECREGQYRLVADIRANPGEVNQPHGGGEGKVTRLPASSILCGGPATQCGGDGVVAGAPVKVAGVTYDGGSGTRRYCYNTVMAGTRIELHCKEGGKWAVRHMLNSDAICYEHASPFPDPLLPLHL